MMYHFMFGLRGGSMPCGTAAAASSAASEFRFFVSSSIVFGKIAPICRLAVREVAQDLVNAPPDNGVHNPEVGSEQENGDYHHPGRRLHLFQRRGSDLLHLRAHVLVEALGPLRPRFQPRAQPVSGTDLDSC